MIETNMTKKDLENLKNSPYFNLMKIFFGNESTDKLISKVEKELEEKETKKVTPKSDYIPHKTEVKIPETTTVYKTVKIDKEHFIKFINAFADAVDDIDQLGNYGVTFDANSPVCTYENLLSGLLESIFGKDALPIITNYIYGDSDDSAEMIWNKIKNL